MKIKIYCLYIFLFLCIGCAAKKNVTQAHCNYQLKCAGYGHDGTQKVYAWGEGRNLKEAREDALKNAVHGTIFKGVQDEVDGCRKSPLLPNPNARQQHSDYFDAFFSPQGEYVNHVSQVNSGSKDVLRAGKKQLKSQFLVVVNLSSLKRSLKAAGILKGLNY